MGYILAVDDEELAARSYTMNFFNDVEALNNSLAHYANSLLTLKTLHGDDKPEQLIKNLEENEQAQVIGIIQGMRFCSIRVYIKLSAIMAKMPELEPLREKITGHYQKITSVSVPDYSVVESYALLVNDALLTSVKGSELFRSSQDYYSKASAINQ